MGATVSTDVGQVHDAARSRSNSSVDHTASEADVVALLMPLYHTSEPLTIEEKEAAEYCWRLSVKNQCQCFHSWKAAHPDCGLKIVGEFLHVCFYERLFLIHPSCRSLFQRDISRMNLIPMVSLCLTKLGDRAQLRKSLVNLVSVHNRIGVKAVECKPSLPITLTLTLTPCMPCPRVLCFYSASAC